MAARYKVERGIQPAVVLRNHQPEERDSYRPRVRLKALGTKKFGTRSMVSEAEARAIYRELVSRYCEAYSVKEALLSCRGVRSSQAVSNIRKIIAHDLIDRGASFLVAGAAMGLDHSTIVRAASTPREAAEALLLARIDPAYVEQVRGVALSARRWALDSRGVNGLPEAVLFDEWNRAVSAYYATAQPDRSGLWQKLCRGMFPHSWQHQAAVPPRGPQEVPA